MDTTTHAHFPSQVLCSQQLQPSDDSRQPFAADDNAQQPTPINKGKQRHIKSQYKILEMESLYASGKTLQEIANIYGISRQRVQQKLKGHITGSVGGRTIKRIVKDLAKNKRVAERKAYSEIHGRKSKYNHGCRCELCTKANTDYCRESRNRMKWERAKP
jgi:hypothetical protein